MITGMDRLLAAIDGRPCDRIPIFCNLLDQGARELGMPLQEYYSRGEYVAEGQLRMREKFGHDNVWCLFYVGRDAEMLGCKDIVFAGDGPPNVAEFIIKSLTDIEQFKVPDDILGHPAFIQELECMRMLRKAVGGQYPICVYVTATMALPAILMGMEKWLELIMLGPESARDALLEKCHEFFVRKTNAYRAAGADIVLYSNPFGSTDIIPMPFFSDHALPWIVKDINAIGSAGVVYYCGMARLNPVLEQVIDSTRIPAYYLSPLDGITLGKKAIGGRGLTCGVINDIKLIDWSPLEVRAQVQSIIQEGMPGGNFLFGTGVMPYCIPETNIRAMMDAAFEYGALEDSPAP